MAASHAVADINVVACESCRTKKCRCDRRLPVCSQCIAGGIQCNYPESNKRGFPPGYIAALERRLLETELALFDALKDLHLMHVSSLEDPTSEDDLVAREQQANLKINKSLTKHSANQSKTDKVAEWDTLPLSSKEHHFEWWKDRLAMAGPPGEALLQRMNNIRSPQSVAAMSFFAGVGGAGSSSNNARRFPYLAGEGSHQSQGGSYRSPSGSNDGSMTETTMLMMPPPPRPSMVSWTSGQSSESTGYSSMQTSPQAQQPSPGESVTAGQLPAPYAWPESMAQQQSEMNMAMSQGGGGTADSSTATHASSSNSSAQRLSSSQWRKFF